MRVKRKSANQKNKEVKEKYKSGKVTKDKVKIRNVVRKLRENKEFRAKEKGKVAEYITQKRKNEEYREKEKETFAGYITQKRRDEEYREKEKEKTAEYMTQKRKDEEYRKKEKENFAEYITQKRKDEEYRKKEKENFAEYITQKRKDEEYREKEKEKTAEYMTQKRKDEEYRKKEKENFAEYITQKRKDEEYRKKEKENFAEYITQKRKDEEYREKEKEKTAEYMSQKRINEEYREKEKEKDVVYKSQKREDKEYRQKEKENTAEYMSQKRKDKEYRDIEKEKDSTYKKRIRKDPEYKQDEKRKNAEAKQLKRDDEDFREVERLNDLKNKKKKMDVDIIRSRQIFYNSLIRKENCAELEFIRQRKCTPKFICCCCEGTFFEHYVSKFKRAEIEKKFKTDFIADVFNTDSEDICKTCQKYVNKGQVPKMSTSNGLEYVPVPACLQNLSSLEERMTSPYINFMQIKPLMHYSLNGQLGMKGSVVNVEVEINEMLDVLPRRFDQMQTIQVVLKRHILHKSDYMKETIRPHAVCEALKYLLTTPLYEKYNIRIDPQYLANHENCIDEEIEFVVDKQDNKILESECIAGVIDDLDDEDDDEVLLVDRNKEMVDDVQTMAPGQGKPPVPWHAVDDLEELSFPKIFCGHPVKMPKGVSYSERVKSESRRHDRRSCGPTRVLYMAKKKMEKACLANMNICLRKQKGAEKATKANVLDEEYINNKIKFDEGYKFLKQVRSSPAYWEAKKKELMAMIRQLGKPDIFLTISAAEKKWPELLQVLADFNLGKKLTLEEACLLDEKEKTALIQKDPIMCARYFDYKANKFMAYLKDDSGVLKDYPLEDKYERVEFQMRGSPHEHIFLWLRNTPKYDSTKPETNAECVEFIDSLMTCRYDPDDDLIAFQKHIHTHTCYKGLKSKKLKTCRFHYPRPVTPKTMILVPLYGDELESKELHEKDFARINDYMLYLYKQLVVITFEELLKKLEMDERRYILALRSSIKEPQVFLKRSSLEVGINSYNRTMLHLFEANMDIQFVLNEYGLASYIINYIAKSDAGISKFIKRAAEDADCKNLNIREKFKNIINAFINCNLMSAQEASYHAMSMPLSKSSRICVYINTSPIAERVRMLKMHKDLQKLAADSTDVFLENLMEKYAARPNDLTDVCLADFAACYSKMNSNSRLQQDNLNEDEEADEAKFKLRGKPAIIRYRRYNLEQDAPNYYREQVLLFVPWRKEFEEVESQDCSEIYIEKNAVIDRNREKYSILDEDSIEAAMDRVNEDCLAAVNEEIEEFEKEKLASGQEVNILAQDGREVTKKKDFNRFVTPQRIPVDDIREKMSELNVGQKEFVMHVLHWLKTREEPLRIFLSGSAGVGKSTVIKALYHSVTRHFDNLHGETFDKMFVLICAPSGKAAFLINGVTLHTAFALPVTQFAGNMPELASDIANTIREKLMYVKLLIIDEISMVGSTLFSRVDSRLRQITGINQSFGGISVICVGDLMQLPPVMDTVIYKMPKNHEMCELFDENPLWKEFKYYELLEIMRQKNDADFISALNNLAVGKMTLEDVELIRSRETKVDDVPAEAIYLYAENANVDRFNEKKIDEHDAEEFISEAEDNILGKVSESTKKSVLNALRKKKTNEVNGLPCLIRFKIGIKYMITYNIDVEDGLVNGACGMLEFVTFATNTNQPKIVWINFFNEAVGKKARVEHKNFMEANKIENHLVPICKTAHVLNLSNKLQHQITRTQFSLVPAMALTIHKSQGQTYESVCVDFRMSKRTMQRQMLYVALSRVTSLNGLYILGNFKAPKTIDEEKDATLKELKKLKNENKLTLCYDTLRNGKCTKVIYQNVCSLLSKWKCITSDQWYGRGDVVIFAETLLKNNDSLKMDSFEEVYRSSCTEKTRGLSCFAKTEIARTNLQFDRTMAQTDKGHVELLHFQLEEYDIITGYKSPQLPQTVFEKCLRDLLSKHGICQKNWMSSGSQNKIIFLGDFNFNIFDQDSSFLQSALSEYSLKSILPKHCVTTDNNTQIDVVFSTSSPHLKAGTYETYFSYHKPIFVMLRDEFDTAGDSLADVKPSQIMLPKKAPESKQTAAKPARFNFKQFLDNKAKHEASVICITNENDETLGWLTCDESVIDQPVRHAGLNCAKSFPASTEQEAKGSTKCITETEDPETQLVSAISVLSLSSESSSSQDSNRRSNLPIRQNFIETVLNPQGYLNCDHMDKFNQILLESTEFLVQNSLLIQIPQMIERRAFGVPNLQILFAGNVKSALDIGHWICVHYDGSILHVYDSFNSKRLHKECENYIKCMYGNNYQECMRTIFHDVQNQLNAYDCGIFAIANATSIALGLDPSKLQYKRNLMRRHVARILTNRELTPFEINTKPSCTGKR